MQLFIDLYTSGAEVPPIQIVEGTRMIHEGRHRTEALRRMERKSAVCVYVPRKSMSGLLMDAYAANMSNCPFPPTRDDTLFVMKQLLEQDARNGDIQKQFERFYPPSLVKKMLRDAQALLHKSRMRKAINAVAHGDQSVEVAARSFDVNIEQLRGELAGTRRKQKSDSASIADLKSAISNRYKGNSTKTAAVFRDLLNRCEDGDLATEKVLDVLLHVQRLNNDAAKRIEHWVERLNTLKKSSKKVA